MKTRERENGANPTTLIFRLSDQEKRLFKVYAATQETTMQALLQQFVRRTIRNMKTVRVGGEAGKR